MQPAVKKKSLLKGGAWIGYVLIAPCMIGIFIFNFIKYFKPIRILNIKIS